MQFGGKSWIRWPIGLAAVAYSFKLAYRVSQSGSLFSVGPLLVSISLLIVAAVCFCPEVVRTATAPLTRWIDSIYLPGGRPEPAPFSLRLANHYVQTRQLDLAAAEYHRLLADYPHEPQAYSGLVRLLATDLEDPRAARRWLRRALRKVEDQHQRDALRAEFKALLVPTGGADLT